MWSNVVVVNAKKIMTDQDLLNRILGNLMSNAVQAMTRGEKLWVALAENKAFNLHFNLCAREGVGSMSSRQPAYSNANRDSLQEPIGGGRYWRVFSPKACSLL